MIFLREICLNDLPIINKWRNDPDLVSNLVAPFRFINFETDKNWFDNYMRNRGENIRCVICLTECPEEIVGSIGLLNIDSVNLKADFYIQIGDAQKRGKGIGSEATIQILRHAFMSCNLNRVQLTVLETNKAALKLYEKCGFKVEGVQKKSVYKNGKYVDLILMAILKEDFCK